MFNRMFIDKTFTVVLTLLYWMPVRFIAILLLWISSFLDTGSYSVYLLMLGDE